MALTPTVNRAVSPDERSPSVENGPPGYSPRLDDVLPAGLEFRDEGETEYHQLGVSGLTLLALELSSMICSVTDFVVICSTLH